MEDDVNILEYCYGGGGGGCQVYTVGSKDPNHQCVHIYSTHFALTNYTMGGGAVKIIQQGARTPIITAYTNTAHTLLDQLYYFIVLNFVVVFTNNHLGSGC